MDKLSHVLLCCLWFIIGLLHVLSAVAVDHFHFHLQAGTCHAAVLHPAVGVVCVVVYVYVGCVSQDANEWMSKEAQISVSFGNFQSLSRQPKFECGSYTWSFWIFDQVTGQEKKQQQSGQRSLRTCFCAGLVQLTSYLNMSTSQLACKSPWDMTSIHALQRSLWRTSST